LYGFVHNNPLTGIDPLGLKVTWFGGWRDSDVPEKERGCYNRCMESSEAGRWLMAGVATAIGGFGVGAAAGSIVPGIGTVGVGVVGAVGGFVSGWGAGRALTGVADRLCKVQCRDCTGPQIETQDRKST